jgi:hypothetical protein
MQRKTYLAKATAAVVLLAAPVLTCIAASSSSPLDPTFYVATSRAMESIRSGHTATPPATPLDATYYQAWSHAMEPTPGVHKMAAMERKPTRCLLTIVSARHPKSPSEGSVSRVAFTRQSQLCIGDLKRVGNLRTSNPTRPRRNARRRWIGGWDPPYEKRLVAERNSGSLPHTGDPARESWTGRERSRAPTIPLLHLAAERCHDPTCGSH